MANEQWIAYGYEQKEMAALPEQQRLVYTASFGLYSATEKEAVVKANQDCPGYFFVAAEPYHLHQATRSLSNDSFAHARARLDLLLYGREKPATSPPSPSIPPEVHSSTPFSPSLAWRATRIAAGDPLHDE